MMEHKTVLYRNSDVEELLQASVTGGWAVTGIWTLGGARIISYQRERTPIMILEDTEQRRVDKRNGLIWAADRANEAVRNRYGAGICESRLKGIQNVIRVAIMRGVN